MIDASSIIDAFITSLADHATPHDSFNPYRHEGRRANLRRYLMQMHARQPHALLLMEAPGYRGCRLTGIPVTSRKIMLEGVPELGLFGAGYVDVRDDGFDDIYGEQSATIVWGTLAELGKAPLIWNACPFHPHKADAPRTNRKPRLTDELTPSMPYLERLLDSFTPSRIIAVGNVAHEMLNRLNVPNIKIRHPAQGGKHDFVAGLRAHL